MGFNTSFNSSGGATVLTDLEVDGTTLVVDEVNNRVGVGDGAPGTTLQVKGTAPYVTVQNSTSENTDGGCESKLIFEDHANVSLGQIEVSHSGSSDDTKGKMILSTHTGSSLTAAITIDEAQKVTAAGNVEVTGDITVTGGDIAYGATNSTLAVGATAHDAAGATLSISGGATTAGTSNNQAGGSVTISGGQGKGSGAGGDIVFKTANAGSSGSSLNALATALTISDDLSSTFAGVVNTGVVNSTVTAATGATLDQNFTVTTASTTIGLDIDFDKTGSSTSDNTMIGINVDMDNTTATNGTNTMVGAKLTPTLQHASAAGTTLVKGIEITATGSGPGNTTTRAIDLTATGADFNQGLFMKIDDGGPDIKMLSSADVGDFCTISTGANGALTITTTDDDGANGHINLEPDGDVIIKGTTPKLIIGDAGAEDTMLVFDGNAEDFRIGIDDGTDTLEIGIGAAHGTTPIIKIDSATNCQVMHNSAVADGEYSGDLAMYTAGEDLTAGEVVYFKSDAKVWKAVATAEATSRCVAMCMATVSADAMGVFLLKGFARFNSEFPTWTVGGALFTPEAETSSKNVPEQTAPDTDGDFVQVIGYAISADAVYFNPDSTVIEVA